MFKFMIYLPKAKFKLMIYLPQKTAEKKGFQETLFKLMIYLHFLV